ncbi:hypothetical protein QAD02_001523 [Eretmocerus hayati]|uniref:Uncharacterized protein n=1 Tax=Eretmocerus hayati TaxID=131215 RepID=A0ACC2NIV9_9HYME|nr:hypothetical protein QAD02_001523 [Eretmocerus hayati]
MSGCAESIEKWETDGTTIAIYTKTEKCISTLVALAYEVCNKAKIVKTVKAEGCALDIQLDTVENLVEFVKRLSNGPMEQEIGPRVETSLRDHEVSPENLIDFSEEPLQSKAGEVPCAVPLLEDEQGRRISVQIPQDSFEGCLGEMSDWGTLESIVIKIQQKSKKRDDRQKPYYKAELTFVYPEDVAWVLDHKRRWKPLVMPARKTRTPTQFKQHDLCCSRINVRDWENHLQICSLQQNKRTKHIVCGEYIANCEWRYHLTFCHVNQFSSLPMNPLNDASRYVPRKWQ